MNSAKFVSVLMNMFPEFEECKFSGKVMIFQASLEVVKCTNSRALDSILVTLISVQPKISDEFSSRLIAECHITQRVAVSELLYCLLIPDSITQIPITISIYSGGILFSFPTSAHEY